MVKKMGLRLREITPAAEGSQDTGSRNLGPAFLVITVYLYVQFLLPTAQKQAFFESSILLELLHPSIPKVPPRHFRARLQRRLLRLRLPRLPSGPSSTHHEHAGWRSTASWTAPKECYA